MAYYVYILASRKDGAIHIGVTNDIVRRVYEHQQKAVPSFTSKYNITRLVWFEIYDDPITAITREKGAEKVEAGLEGEIDRGGKSTMARSIRIDLQVSLRDEAEGLRPRSQNLATYSDTQCLKLRDSGFDASHRPGMTE